MGKASGPKTPRERGALTPESPDDEIIVAIDKDPDWHPIWASAISALMGYERRGVGWEWTGNYDVRQMAAALASGLTIPREVRQYLATVLDPHKEWVGPKVRIDRRPKKSIGAAMGGLAKMRTIRDEYRRALENGEKSHSLEASLAKKYGVGRTFIRGAIKLTDKDLVARSCKILGAHIVGSSRSEKS